MIGKSYCLLYSTGEQTQYFREIFTPEGDKVEESENIGRNYRIKYGRTDMRVEIVIQIRSFALIQIQLGAKWKTDYNLLGFRIVKNI